MDDNTRQVLVAAVAVIGPLGGVWLGWFLQSRRRHEAAKRQAYADFIGVTRNVIAVLNHRRESDNPGATEAPDEMAREVWQTLGFIQIVGGRRATAAAQTVQGSIGAWIGDPDRSSERWAAGLSMVDDALLAFIGEARKDLGER